MRSGLGGRQVQEWRRGCVKQIKPVLLKLKVKKQIKGKLESMTIST